MSEVDTGEVVRPDKTGENRNEDGTFVKGISGNPAGRPIGTVSIVTKIKQKFLENPEYFEEWVSKLMEDPKERRAIMEQIDGKPKQPIVGDTDAPLIIKMVQYGADDSS